MSCTNYFNIELFLRKLKSSVLALCKVRTYKNHNEICMTAFTVNPNNADLM